MASTTTKLLIQSLMQKKADALTDYRTTELPASIKAPLSNSEIIEARATRTNPTTGILSQLFNARPDSTDMQALSQPIPRSEITAGRAKRVAPEEKSTLQNIMDIVEQYKAGPMADVVLPKSSTSKAPEFSPNGTLTNADGETGPTRSSFEPTPSNTPPGYGEMSTGKKAAIIAAILTGAAGVGYGINKMVSKKKPAKTAEKE